MSPEILKLIWQATLDTLSMVAAAAGIGTLLGLVLTMTAIYGQVVINDAMVARYVPAQHRAKAFSVRYFLGFTVSGFVVPMLAVLYARGGFGLVRGAAALFGLVVWSASVAFYWLAQGTRSEMATPAE